LTAVTSRRKFLHTCDSISDEMSRKNSPSDQKRLARERAEYLRGRQEAATAIEKLQALWPAAFPKDPKAIKPLSWGVVAEVAAATGWDKRYVAGVLGGWRLRVAYRAAVLRSERYYDLNGQPTENLIDEDARERARRPVTRPTAINTVAESHTAN
jgi:sRNA-binding protein